MKITCQACQSKYTIADDKIQGKVAKIRCRKCGATVLVDASAGAQPVNGATAAASGGDTWSVSVTEGDQRNMRVSEVVDAYNTGVITGDTYVWKEGMGDWQALSEVPALVEALNQAANDAPASTAQAPDSEVQARASTPPAASGAAARRENGRSRDLFGQSASDDEVATSVASEGLARGAGGLDVAGAQDAAGLTGARDEHSVLFSLTALTNNSAPLGSSAGMGNARNDDSGLIDLNALAQAQQQIRPSTDVASSPLLAPPSPFLFPAALGTVEPITAAEDKKKSLLPLIVGGGIAVAAIGLAIALLAGDKKKDDVAPAVTAASAATVAATAEPTAPSVAAAPSATAADTAAEPASSAAKTASRKPAGSPRPAAAPKAPAAAAAPAAPAAPKPKASPCGCAPGDLQCQIRCSATGH